MIYRYYHQNKTAAKLPVFKKFLTCYEQMNDYDKLLFNNFPSLQSEKIARAYSIEDMYKWVKDVF